MKKHPIAITIRSFGLNLKNQKELQKTCSLRYINTTGNRLTGPELSEILKGIEGVIAGTEPFSRQVIESATDLRVISRVGVGLDSIDLDAAKERGIAVKNTPDAPVQAVAEHTLALILDLLKKITAYNTNIHRGDFHVETGRMLAGKRVGIIGLGRIGTRVATLASALGCTIAYYDPFRMTGLSETWQACSSMEQLLETSDIVTLHMTPHKSEKPLLDTESLSLIKNGAVVINTARGSLIDEPALIHALSSGRIAGAGLDVFSHEPYSGRLLEFPQVVMTPHVASNTDESRQQMEIEAVNNIITAFEE
ncbi:phosphoglycerate dehydrogenase [Methanoregula sp.]|uniref:phosphoglycerate dehydrogenase n=1 Tax=Methanoregula sp. TaxID=2052170 RepID=UPI003568D1E3